MKIELEKKLVAKYPDIFRDYRGDIRKTAMGWGMECGDGWYNLIDNLCNDIKQLSEGKCEVVAVQVKEKFGGLRFYVQYSEADDETYDKINAKIDKAEEDSYEICEVCGEKGKLYDGGWYIVRCEKHKRED